MAIAGGATLFGAAAGGSGSNTPAAVCVRDIGDVNGDGRRDYAVSRRGAARPVAFIVHGDGQVPEFEALRQGRRRAALVLRGAEAEPLLCPEMPVRRAPRQRPGEAGRPLTAVAALDSNGPLHRPPSFTVVDLDPLMPGFSSGFSSAAAAVNVHGDVVGRYGTVDGDRAYLYRQGSVYDLGTLGGRSSAATGINDHGEVVGYSLTGAVGPEGFISAAFRYGAGIMQDLGLSWGDARAINNAGLIVGQMRFTPEADRLTAFSMGSAGPLELGFLPPFSTPSSVALAVNAAGRIVGESVSRIPGRSNPAMTHPSVHAVIFENGVARDLGFLERACFAAPGAQERCVDRASATAVTDRGLIAGFSTTAGGTHAFVSDGGALIDLGTLDGASTFAYGANESGQVVGTAQPEAGSPRPFLYDGGVMYDLTTLVEAPASFSSLGASAINSFGVIALQHHLLTPNYDFVTKGRPFSFSATLSDTLAFEYWSAGLGAAECAGGSLAVQVRFVGARTSAWTTAAIGDCQTPAWHPVTVPVPARLRGTPVHVELRLRQPDSDAAGQVHLRRFRSR
jgi:probable HAF family extracellular repeat protein